MNKDDEEYQEQYRQNTLFKDYTDKPFTLYSINNLLNDPSLDRSMIVKKIKPFDMQHECTKTEKYSKEDEKLLEEEYELHLDFSNYPIEKLTGLKNIGEKFKIDPKKVTTFIFNGTALLPIFNFIKIKKYFPQLKDVTLNNNPHFKIVVF